MSDYEKEITSLEDKISRDWHWIILLIVLIVLTGSVVVILIQSKKVKVY